MSGGFAAGSATLLSDMGEGSDGFLEGLKVIGVFAVCNTGGICVHAIDHTEKNVLASMNGKGSEMVPHHGTAAVRDHWRRKGCKDHGAGILLRLFFRALL